MKRQSLSSSQATHLICPNPFTHSALQDYERITRHFDIAATVGALFRPDSAYGAGASAEAGYLSIITAKHLIHSGLGSGCRRRRHLARCCLAHADQSLAARRVFHASLVAEAVDCLPAVRGPKSRARTCTPLPHMPLMSSPGSITDAIRLSGDVHKSWPALRGFPHKRITYWGCRSDSPR